MSRWGEIVTLPTQTRAPRAGIVEGEGGGSSPTLGGGLLADGAGKDVG
jgi:hypothetical protein